MGVYDNWVKIEEKDQKYKEKYYLEYYKKEKYAYSKILEEKANVVEGTIAELAAGYNMEPFEVAGFIEGINESLITSIDYESLEEDSKVYLDIDFKKLYVNMIDAKAEWLYTLSEWESIFTEEERNEFKKEYNRERIAVSDKVGRNEPCPCGSGKKYKKCCG
jgi:hypothetical protein